jgi:hypothetical protein
VSDTAPRYTSAAKSSLWRRELTKTEVEQLEIIIENSQSDPNYLRLLQILGEQLELLINEGRPDLHSLLTSLEAAALVSEEECRELRAAFALEAVSDSCAMKKSQTDSDVPDIGCDTKRLIGYRC